MKHSAQIVTLSAQRLAYGSTRLEPAETRPKSNFPESRVAISNVRPAKLNTDETILMHSTDHFGENALTAPFNNMRTLKFKAQPTNGFFAAVNQVFGGSS